MKSVIFFTLLFLAINGIFAIANECNPDGDGEPICSDSNVNVPVRNNADPTAYWLCTSADAKAVLKRCPSASLFNSSSQSCIPAAQWVWTPPCPEQ